MKTHKLITFLLVLIIYSTGIGQNRDIPFVWENSTVYFVLTDRFENGDTSNDFAYGRQRNGPALRNFEGGDLQGLINKVNSGYFDDLGVNAIWVTPPYENIHGSIGGAGYAFHGYWAKDWTTIDRNLGTEDLFRQFVDVAHDHGIRVIMDVVLNHVGPDNTSDESWPNEWVRRDPTCNFQGPSGNIPCELVDNLPDIRTESNSNVSVPGWLLDKWDGEGRKGEEEEELNDFFNNTGFPRAPRFYIIKWLTDYVRKYGVDGFRVDTVKHVEEFVWKELEQEGIKALKEWKNNNPNKKIDDIDFWMTGEIFNYNAPSMGRRFTGDGFNVDYYDNGFANLINFEFRFNANDGLESIFTKYDNLLQNQLGNGKSAMNFLANHDTDQVFDRNRTRTFEAGTKLLLTPGPAQIYYGDETARTLTPGGGASGDATLRSNMNFNELGNPNSKASLTLKHFQRLGKFRREHVSVGAGKHNKLQDSPYAFKREFNSAGISDKTLVYVGKDGDFLGSLNVFGMWPNGTELRDYFSKKTAIVTGGIVNFGTNFGMVLIGASSTVSNSVSLTVNPASGVYIDSVTIDMNASSSSGEQVQIYYTLDGTEPNASSTLYTNPFTIIESKTIKAIAIANDGDTSTIVTRDYSINDGQPFNVYFKKPSNWSTAFIYIFNKTTGSPLADFPAWPGASMDKVGDTPWYMYLIDEDAEVGIVFNDDGGSQSDDLTRVSEGWYDNQWTNTCPSDCPLTLEVPDLVISPESGTFNNSVEVTMNATNSGTIFYTLDGTIPDTSSTVYTGSFTISSVGTHKLRAIAINDAGSSSVVNRNYAITDTTSTSFTINFRKPNNWGTSYVYLYDKNANTVISGFPAWPGIQMSELGSSPWYTYTVDESVEVGIVFNDNGGAQLDDLFRTTDGWYNGAWTNICPEECPEITPDISFDVYFKKPSSWSTPFIYIYDKNANTAISGAPSWPGTPMNAINGSPWYSYTIDESVEVGIVFNDNGGSQTDDLFRISNGWYDNQWFDSCPNNCPAGSSKASFDNKKSNSDLIKLVTTWPNPFKESLTLSFTGNMNNNFVNLEIYDLSGKKTNISYSKDAKTNTIFIPTESLSKGIYLLKIISNDNLEVMKIIK